MDKVESTSKMWEVANIPYNSLWYRVDSWYGRLAGDELQVSEMEISIEQLAPVA